MLKKFLFPGDSKTNILIRFVVGAVFLSEGIQKFIFEEALGAGRFAKIGFPAPEFLANFVGCFEIICGTLVLLGLLTRFASIPLIIIMLVSITTTKLPMLAATGFWNMLHESRTDWSMLLGSIFLLLNGSGSYSIDFGLFKKGN
jgi:putative oxidoreductase